MSDRRWTGDRWRDRRSDEKPSDMEPLLDFAREPTRVVVLPRVHGADVPSDEDRRKTLDMWEAHDLPLLA